MATDNDLALDELRSLASDRALVEQRFERRYLETIARHRHRGVPWSVIGEALGVTRQSAHERWAGPVREGHLPGDDDVDELAPVDPTVQQGQLL